MIIFDTIKNVIIPAVKEELKRGCEDWVENTLYNKPYDFSQVTPGVGKDSIIRVIGRIVARY